ncbi:MAG: sigma-70 family RNA polymerase sigma factor, partial [Chitinivibrionales bacterium]|nr:sigma-70 family RNA polymerase sigma factor [Chitinivibrionales bacterium]
MAPKATRVKGSNAGRHRPKPWRKSRPAPISEPSVLTGPRSGTSSGSVGKSALGSYLADISRSCPLAPNEEAELALRIRRGDQKALHRLITANLRFVVSVARNYQHQGVPLEDLVNEGNIGLIRAARKFDEKKNFKFISY